MSDLKEKIGKLVEKAANAEKSGDAVQFAQAALHAANALVYVDMVRDKPREKAE